MRRTMGPFPSCRDTRKMDVQLIVGKTGLASTWSSLWKEIRIGNLMDKKAVRQLCQETEDKVKHQYARAVKWGDIKNDIPPK